MGNHYDLIVVGLGAMGSAALYQAAKSGVNVLGIDRYSPPHEFGSSHAETRITRLAVGEGPEYLPLVARSHEIWRELEAKTGQPLLYQSGLYIIARNDATSTANSHWDRFVQRTADVAASANIPYEIRSPAQVRAHIPQVRIGENDTAGFEQSGGVILSELAVETQLKLAKAAGAAVQTHEPVLEIQFHADCATVITQRDRYQAAKVIISVGAWMKDFLPTDRQNLLRVTRQAVFWFEAEDQAVFSTDRFPGILWLGDTTEDYMGIFPVPPGSSGIKLLTEQFHTATDPAAVSRTITQEEIDHFYQNFVARKLMGVTAKCVKSAVCLYTNTPDEHFIIDHYPESERVIVASPCSGHGFKHSAAIGEAMVQLAMNGTSKIDLSSFSFARFNS